MEQNKSPGATGAAATAPVQRPHPESLTSTAQKHEVAA